jgi:hypothetical protein
MKTVVAASGLFAMSRYQAAGPGTRCDAGKAGELATIVEGSVEHLANQPGGELRPDQLACNASALHKYTWVGRAKKCGFYRGFRTVGSVP